MKTSRRGASRRQHIDRPQLAIPMTIDKRPAVGALEVIPALLDGHATKDGLAVDEPPPTPRAGQR
jgi:hypothetical protein